ncbi:sugar ABC transporter permease [Candidatus Binatia bacterium]|nr:sugar ABC transporter permease [Candidatus Binatia bacterium]
MHPNAERGWWWALPAAPLLAYFALFLVYPTVYAVNVALTDPLTGAFPSLGNARTLWRDGLFWRAVAGNVVVPVASVAVEVVAGLALALFLSTRLPARRLLRATVIVPFALPEIVVLSIMRAIFASRGYANAALLAAGVEPVEWLVPGTVTAYLTVIAVDAWHVTPVVFLMLLAARAAIPDEIDEAARLDGAGWWRRAALITVPLLRPALGAAVLLRGVDAMRVFATPLVLTGVEGVPVMSSYAWHQWSDYGDDGAAAAAACVLALACTALAVPLLRRRVAA